MYREARFHNSIFGVAWNSALALMIVLLVLLAVVLSIVFTAQPVEGQTYRVIYNFTGGADGANPNAGLAMDALGNLYGVTPYGGRPTCRGEFGNVGCGTVFELAHLASGWALVTLYRFQGGTDGYFPSATLAFGPDGNLYGTTADSDLGYDLRRMEGLPVQQDNCSPQCGTVFKVARSSIRPPGVFAGWQHTKLYRFQGPPDGNQPYHSPVTFDSQGNIFVTTERGGAAYPGGGTVAELTLSGGEWSEAVIYDFTAGWGIGSLPMSGVIVDTAGNLYGTTFTGGFDPPDCNSGGAGAVFELSPSESGWNASCLHSFTGGSDGASPVAGLVSDSSGNLYGATSAGYPTPHATIFMLSPSPSGWVYHLLYTFDNDDESPWATLAMDAAGNLYGETYADNWGVNMGHVFKLTRGSSGWTYSNLHAFCSWQNCTDGVSALSGVLVDRSGNLYGTTTQGGAYGAYGVVWEITP